MRVRKFLVRATVVAIGVLAIVTTGCGGKQHSHHGTNMMGKAQLVAIYDRSGYDEVYIVSPDGEEVGHYILIDRNDTSTHDIPEDAIAIRIPLENLVLDSEIYASALEELGAENAIKGLFDSEYATSPAIKAAVAEGKIADIGKPSFPNLEKISALQPQAMLLSYFDGMQTQSLDKLDIPIIKMYDLQEPSPLGRAEWLRLLGRLTGREEMADNIFEEVKKQYEAIASSSNSPSVGSPKVITEIIYNGVWSVPGGESYQARMIKDAGGKYFKSADRTPVTLNLAPEQVIAEGEDADIWLIRYYGNEEELKSILESDPIYSLMAPYKNGMIYMSDTSESGLFREFPFHPERLLKDYRIIFSGDTTQTPSYFKKLE